MSDTTILGMLEEHATEILSDAAGFDGWESYLDGLVTAITIMRYPYQWMKLAAGDGEEWHTRADSVMTTIADMAAARETASK